MDASTLQQAIASKNVTQQLAELFYGLDSCFSRHFRALDVKQLNSIGEEISKAEHRWKLLRALAAVARGEKDAATASADALAQLTVDSNGLGLKATMPPDPHSPTPFQVEIAKNLTNGLPPDGWTPALWLFLEFAASQYAPTANDTERTPVLFVGGQEYVAMTLAAERRPGPRALVAPDWWRLGPLPLPTAAIKTINDAFLQVWTARAADGFGLRWWFEKYEDSPWPTNGFKFGEAVSAQAAAGCVALALTEATRTQPLLGDLAVVSAELGTSANGKVLETPLKVVGGARTKVVAARAIGRKGIVFADGQNGVTETPDGFVETVATLGAAYDSMLAASAKIVTYLKGSRKGWTDTRIELETPPNVAKAFRNDQ